jgi:hypothetical protein
MDLPFVKGIISSSEREARDEVSPRCSVTRSRDAVTPRAVESLRHSDGDAAQPAVAAAKLRPAKGTVSTPASAPVGPIRTARTYDAILSQREVPRCHSLAMVEKPMATTAGEAPGRLPARVRRSASGMSEWSTVMSSSRNRTEAEVHAMAVFLDRPRRGAR